MNDRLIWGVWSFVAGYFLAISFPHFHIPWYIWPIILIPYGLGWIVQVPGRKILELCFICCLALSYYHVVVINHITHIQVADLSSEQSVNALNGAAMQIKGRIISPVSVDGNHVGFVVAVHNIDFSIRSASVKLQQPAKEPIQTSITLLSQMEQKTALKWRRGDNIDMQGTLQLPAEASNFGAFDYRAYLQRQYIQWQFSIKSLDHVQVTTNLHWGILRLLRVNDQFRDMMAEKLAQIFPANQAGYMQSLLIGLRVSLDPQQFQQFSDLGLTHLLAISGMQIAVFCSVLLWIFRKLRITRETSCAMVIVLLPCYILVTGSQPSVARAGLIAMIALFAARKSQFKNILTLLCLVGLLMLIWNPYLLLDISFQLSFAVTYGIIVGVPWIKKLLPQRNKRINSGLALMIVAQWISFPLTIYYFNQFSLLSWVANLIFVPFISFIVTPLGTIALLASFVSSTFGHWIAWPVMEANQFTFWLTGIMDRTSLFKLIWPSPALWWIILYYVLSALFVVGLVRYQDATKARSEGLYIYSLDHVRLWSRTIGASFILMMLLLWYGYYPNIWDKAGRVQFIDVGQGDAFLIRSPENHYILIDGGGTLNFNHPQDKWKLRKNPYEVGAKLLVPLLKKRGVHQLDDVISTHEDADHIGGLQAVLEQIPVRRLIFNGTLKQDAVAEKVMQTALMKHIPLVVASTSLLISVDSHTKLQFIAPNNDDLNQLTIEDQQNTKSLVFLLEMDRYHFLFTGDMEKTEEYSVLQHLNGIKPPQIDVLKVAHHGSKTSTTEAWLAYWQPKLAVISVGAHNTYGHPTEEVLSRLVQHHTTIYRTDRQGEIQMQITSLGMQIRTKIH